MTQIQEIYNAYGKYDNVVTVAFLDGSQRMSIYGRSVTGLFHYSQSDRKNLELRTYLNTSEPLKQRFQLILKREYSKELVDDIDHLITSYVIDENGSVKESVKYEKSQIEYYSGHALDIGPEHAEMLNWKGEQVNKLVRTELRKVGIASKTEMYVNLWLYNFLLEKGVQFTPGDITLYQSTNLYGLRVMASHFSQTR